jgi:hypothetical protein
MDTPPRVGVATDLQISRHAVVTEVIDCSKAFDTGALLLTRRAVVAVVAALQMASLVRIAGSCVVAVVAADDVSTTT